MFQQINKEYDQAYQQAWIKFLSSISVKPFLSLNDASKKLSILVNPKGPITQLLKIIHQNIPTLFTSNQFKRLEEYFHALSAVQAEMQSLVMSSDKNQNTQRYALQVLSTQAPNLKLYQSSIVTKALLENVEDLSLRSSLRKLLVSPIQESWRVIIHQAALNIQQKWQDHVFPIYQQTIQNKFPFANFEQNANITDAIDFFKQDNGILWHFVDTQLSPFMTREPQKWSTKKWLDIGINFSKEFLDGLVQVKNITATLFEPDTFPSLRFELYPQPTPSLSRIFLQIGDQHYNYTNGPQQWHPVIWSGNSNQVIKLYGITTVDLHTNSIDFHGPWSIFSLFKTAQIEPQGHGVYQLTWPVHTSDHQHKKISFLLKTDYRNDLFKKRLMEPFYLPNRLLIEE